MDFDDYGYYNYGTVPNGRNGMDFEAFGGNSLIATVGAGVALGMLTLIGLYVCFVWIFRSIGLYHLAKDRGIQHAWFAWVPFLSFYIVGRLINDKVVLGDSIVTTHAEFFLPLLSFLAGSISNVGNWAALFVALVWVYRMSAYWRLFKMYRPKSRTAFTVWSAILGSGFFIFAIRNDRPFDPLDPDKVYENFYAEKRDVQQRYDEMEGQIRERESQKKQDLKNQYEHLISQEGLTEEMRDKIDAQYRAQLNRIETEAEEQINQQRVRERSDIYELDKNKPQEVDETDVYNERIVNISNREPDIKITKTQVEEDVYLNEQTEPEPEPVVIELGQEVEPVVEETEREVVIEEIKSPLFNPEDEDE